MATTNYNLPTISGASPVAIVDDYNGLANATDAAIAGAVSTEKTRAMAAETELANGVSNALSTANNASVSATAANTAAEKASAAVTAEAARAQAAEAGISALFPVGSSNIADGAITAPKLAETAFSAIWQSLEIKHFDKADDSADNTGMSYGSNVKAIAGFYVPSLELLVITRYETGGTDSTVTLPSYISPTTEQVYMGRAAVVYFDTSSDFKSWTGLSVTGRTLKPTTAKSDDGIMFCTCSAYLAPFTSAASAATASDYLDASGVA